MIVLIPAYNEAGRIGQVIREVRATLPTADVLVVNDGSRDDTVAESRAAGARVLSLPVNLGYGAALQIGLQVRGAPPLRPDRPDRRRRPAPCRRTCEKMLEGLADPEVDVVLGSRFLDKRRPLPPLAGTQDGHGAVRAGRLARDAPARVRPDVGLSGHAPPVASFFCSEVYPSDYPDADILILLHRSGFRIREVGVQMREPDGKSMHSGHRSIYYVYKMSLSILVTLLRRASGESRDDPLRPGSSRSAAASRCWRSSSSSSAAAG